MMKQLKMTKTVNSKDEKFAWVPKLVFEFLGSALPLYTAMFVRPLVSQSVRIRKKSTQHLRGRRTAYYCVALILLVFFLSGMMINTT